MIVLSINLFAQTNIIVKNNLKIDHGNIVLYLSDDTCAMVSVNTLKYSDFKKLDKDRDDHWFQDIYKRKVNREAYVNSGYDLGHLTPSHITSYNDSLNHVSFSLFNQAPQIASFNRGKWAQLEKKVEDMIDKGGSDATIVTGVIYDYSMNDYLKGSRVRIPVAYFKILVIKFNVYCWIGSNNNGEIVQTSLVELNQMFTINKMDLQIK